MTEQNRFLANKNQHTPSQPTKYFILFGVQKRRHNLRSIAQYVLCILSKTTENYRNEIVEAIQSMKSGKATGTCGVSVEMIVASGEIGVKVMMELCQRVLDGKGRPDEWKTSVIVPIFKGKGDVMSCGSYRGVKLLEHAMKIVEKVLERRIRTLVNLNEMQFGFMPGKKQWMRYSL